MGESCQQPQLAIAQLDTDRLVARLDRVDILLLRQFYVTGQPVPDDTCGHVLRLLVDRFQKTQNLPAKALSYGAIRHRLENLRALGLIDKIPKTNPAIYLPLDHMANDIRRMILKFAAELVGVRPNPQG